MSLSEILCPLLSTGSTKEDSKSSRHYRICFDRLVLKTSVQTNSVRKTKQNKTEKAKDVKQERQS